MTYEVTALSARKADHNLVEVDVRLTINGKTVEGSASVAYDEANNEFNASHAPSIDGWLSDSLIRATDGHDDRTEILNELAHQAGLAAAKMAD